MTTHITGNAEFSGELKDIDPTRLIKETEKNEISDFFLVLGDIFNDLKGLVLFEKLLNDTYRRPTKDEVSVHAGEYNGARVQIYKLYAATIFEFLEFLRVHASVLTSFEFEDVLSSLSHTQHHQWKEIVDFANGKLTDTVEFAKALELARHGVAFHYYGATKNLHKGFISRFSKRDKVPQSKSAYYSIGDDMATTRFYFADAAVEEYINLIAQNENDSFLAETYQRQLTTLIQEMNFAIASLLKAYLRKRHYS